MANYITTSGTNAGATNVRLTTQLMIGADSNPAQELHVTGEALVTGNITAYYRQSELDKSGRHHEDGWWKINKDTFASSSNNDYKLSVIQNLINSGKIKTLKAHKL